MVDRVGGMLIGDGGGDVSTGRGNPNPTTNAVDRRSIHAAGVDSVGLFVPNMRGATIKNNPDAARVIHPIHRVARRLESSWKRLYERV